MDDTAPPLPQQWPAPGNGSRESTAGLTAPLEARVAELERWVAQHERAAEALAEVGRGVAQALDPEVIGQRIADSVRELFGAQSAVLFRLEPGTDDLVSVAICGNAGPASDSRLVIAKDTGLAGLAVRERQPMVTPDVLNDPRVRLTPDVRSRLAQSPLRAVLSVPLLLQDQVTGVLGVGDRVGRLFGSGEIRLAQAFADQAALALENARLHKDATRREHELAEKSALLQATLEHLSQGVSVVDKDFRLIAWNTRFLEQLGFLRELARFDKPMADFLRHNVARGEYGPGDPDEEVAQRLAVAREVQPHSFERVRPDGTVLEVRGAPMPDGSLVITYTDITERKLAEDALRQSEAHLRQAMKMETVGRLAGGVAHDFGNLLTVITGRCEILLHRLGPNDPLRLHADLIQQTAFRAADLIDQLLAFSRKQMVEPKVLDLNAVVVGMEGMLRRLIGEHIDMVTVCDPTLGRVKADPSQLEQVLMNLAINARDAMPQGGALTIETANVELDETFTRQHVGSRPGPHVMLAVADTGVGMNADTRAHIFEPFFTTKGPGKGTGLGLATVYGIVKQSGGYVWVGSAPGKGTGFEIYLPRVDALVAAPESVLTRRGLPPGSETVLLVEDQGEVRRVHEALDASGRQ